MKAKPLIQKLIPHLFEDDRFLVVDKPAGIDVGGMADRGITGMVELLGELAGGGKPLHVVNRLSRYESGVLILAKDVESAAFVRNGLKAQRVEQEYTAVVIGRMREPKLTLDSTDKPAAVRRPVQTAVRNGRSRPSERMEGAGTARVLAAEPRTATTLTRIRESEKRTLVGCRTSVANTHMLRAKFRAARLRLLGDNVHDSSRRRQLNEQTRLHLTKVMFHHPGTRTRMGFTSRVPEHFSAPLTGEFDVDRPLRAGLVRRAALLMDRDIDCLRLLTGDCEDFPSLNVERYGDVLILQVLDERRDDRALLLRVVKWYREQFGIWAAYGKRFVKDRTKAVTHASDRVEPTRPLWGDSVASQIEVRERRLRLAIRLNDGLNVGLFLDQRDNRARVCEMAAEKDVLNLFAYTCGFSLAAAMGGARSTVSVDLSPKHLEWGRTNFGLNHVQLNDHLFIRSDAFDYLKRAARQERMFDLIVLDPPSFAHGRKTGEDFSIDTDLPKLVAACLAVLRRGGRMMVSTNYRRMPLSGLKERILLGASKRRCKVIATPPLPPDFAVDRDHAKTMFLRFDE